MLRLVVLSVLVGTSLWFDQGTFVPFATDRAISYALSTPSIWWLVADVFLVGIVLGSVSLILEQTLLAVTYSDRSRFGSSDLFMPLAIVALNLVSIGLLADSLRDWWPPVAYIGASLHAVLWCAAIASVARNLYLACSATLREALTARWTALGATRQALLIDVAIAASLAAIVIAASPKIRFSFTPVGDEPKYLRYAENWWQGRGMDMDGIEDASNIPATEQGPRFRRNFAGLVPAVARDLSQLISDVSFLGNSRHWGHQFNRARYVGNWFVAGKNGGLYQMHQPGVSILMFPAYAIDRWLFDRGRSRFADDLFTVNVVMLLIWLAAAGATFRLLHLTTGDRVNASIVALACFASVPLATFVFPFYPETLGALLVSVVARRIIGAERLTASSAAVTGSAIGWLVWLHVRFVVLAFFLFVWIVWTHRRDRSTLVVIAVTCGAVTGAFCLYAYHVTGSLLPSAFYDAGSPDAGFRMARLSDGLLGVLFDRENGLLALAPMYLLALPGIGLMLRHERRTAVVVLSLMAALMVTVAGHGYEAGGTSPLRYMVAVIPLAAVPIAVWLRSIRGRVVRSGLAAVLVVISIQMAVAYNLRNDKTITQTIAAGVSGWDPTFVFPLMRRTEQPGFDREALMAWEIVSLAAIAAGAWLGWNDGAPMKPAPAWRDFARAMSLAIVPLAGLLALAAGGPRRELRLLKTPAQASREWQATAAHPAGFHIGTRTTE